MAEAASFGLREVFGNASSIHRAGQQARQHLEASRRTLAKFLGTSPNELVFTSGGTESNNLAVLGLARSGKHAITTAIEHPSVLEPFRQLGRTGIEVTYARVGRSGVVDVDQIRRNLRDDTFLVSVMHANNEIGTIQPVNEIAAAVRERRAAGQAIYLHSDGVQAAGKMGLDLQKLDVDLYSTSAHKIFGPKGIGALFVRKGTRVESIQHGGRHERERRAGTENVPGAMAFARATELCASDAGARLSTVRDRFESRVLAAMEGVEVNGTTSRRLPNTSNLMFADISGEAMVIALDMQGMAVSTGSACSSGSVEPSHVLLAIGRTREEARSSVRFSFGRYNTVEEADALADAVIASARQLRKSARQEVPLVRV